MLHLFFAVLVAVLAANAIAIFLAAVLAIRGPKRDF
jgi:hypothetical protein